VAALTARFRGTANSRWADRWEAEDYWDVLHAFLRQRSIDPMKTVALAWAVRATSGVDAGTWASIGAWPHPGSYSVGSA
jgi:hypothetical protein